MASKRAGQRTRASIRAAQGAAVGSQSFTVFGEPLAGNGVFGFAGEQQDPTGLLHLRARQYNPGLGRFTAMDPVQPGSAGTPGWNLYGYAGSNPTTWMDPSGRVAISDYALQLTVRAQVFAMNNPVALWIAANPLTLCVAGAGVGAPAYYYAGDRRWSDAGFGALEGCEAGLSLAELADLAIGPKPVQSTSSDTDSVKPTVPVNGKWESNDPLVGSVANAIEDAYPGHVIAVNFPVNKPGTTNSATDFDIVLSNAVIQVKSGTGKGATKQVTTTMSLSESDGLPVIAYLPDSGPHVKQSVDAAGGIAVDNLDDLIELVRP